MHNEALNLDGALKLNSYNSQLLNTNINPGYFFDDVGGSASMLTRASSSRITPVV